MVQTTSTNQKLEVFWRRCVIVSIKFVSFRTGHGCGEEDPVKVLALFGLSVLMSFVASGLLTKLYVWPWLRRRELDALVPLMLPHTMRFIGLSFLVPGVEFLTQSADWTRNSRASSLRHYHQLSLLPLHTVT
jgi:hypothetical protein